MIPLQDFFRKPDKVMLSISPSGKYLAYLEPWQRRLNLTVEDLATGEKKRVTEATERDVGGYLWANDDRLIYVNVEPMFDGLREDPRFLRLTERLGLSY